MVLSTVPRTLDDISVEVIRASLAQFPFSQAISSVNIPKETSLQGAMSTVAKIELHYDKSPVAVSVGPSNLVVKMAAINPKFPEVRDFGSKILLAYKKEVEFYKNLCLVQNSNTNNNTLCEFATSFPHIYFAQFGDSESNDQADAPFFIVMEYVNGAKQQYLGITMDEARAALCSAANLHAYFWHDAQKPHERDAIISKLQSEFNYHVQFEFSKYWLVALFGAQYHADNKSTDSNDPAVHTELYETLEKAWPNFIQVMEKFDFGKYPEFKDYKIRDNIQRLKPFIENGHTIKSFIAEAMKQVCGGKGFQTLLHSDLRTENIVFTYGDDAKTQVTGAKLIDLQCLNFGNVGYDLAHLLATSLPPKQRREQEKQLLREYLEEHLYRLNPKIKHEYKYTFEQLWNDYQLGTMFHALLMLTSSSKWLPMIEANMDMEMVFGRYLYLCMCMIEGDIDAFTCAVEEMANKL